MSDSQEQEKVQQEQPAQQDQPAQQEQPAAQGQAVQPAPQPVPAVGFLVLAFLDDRAADQALDAMKEAKKQRQFYFEDAAVIRQDVQGKVHYHETGDMSTGKGAGIGALVGGILGILGGPAGVALGAGVGAAAGAAISSIDSGFRDESLRTVGVALKPGTSALAAITSHDFLRAVQQQVPIDQIRAAVSNLAAELSARLGENKNVAIGLLLTEKGLAVKEIAANDESAEVVGAVVTDEAMLVGAGVVTPEGAAYQIVGATDEGAAAEAGVVTDEGAVVVDAVALPDKAEVAPKPDEAADASKEEAPAAGDSEKPAPAADAGATSAS
jgi:uncharacterized membrane protein